jgi:hypothetical protein
MKFKYALTVRSQPGKAADYGRALERVAFFPGVTAAQILTEAADSITIGYNGMQQPSHARAFGEELRADGLVADEAMWQAAPMPMDGVANHPLAFRRLTPLPPDDDSLPFDRRQ